MDVFSRTFQPTAAAGGLSALTVSRHLPVLQRCVAREDVAVLVSRCQRGERPASGAHLLLLTNRSLVVTGETRLLRRVRLYLATELRYLSDVMWTPHPRSAALEFAATVVDGVRERFWLRVGDAHRLEQIDALLDRVFGDRTRTPAASASPASR